MSWLYRWPMHDREIVAAIVAGDPAGLAEAYDRYAPALHAFCRSLLAEPSDAADAVQDTFVVAASKLDGLREPDRLRPWLYAVARNECHRRLRARARTADLDEAGEVTDDAPEVGAAAERGELRRLVRSALAGLNPGERDVIELGLHDLDGQDLASALGVPLNQAHALASRARGQLEKSLGVLLVARTGREECQELETILANWDGELTVLMRKRVSRHIENCDVCGERKRRELSPAMLLSALPVIFLPPGLRRQVLSLVADKSPEAARYREHVARRAGPFAASGFPLPVAPVRTFRMPRRTILFTAAAAVLLIAAGGVAAAALMHSGGAPGDAAAHSAATTAPAGASASASASAPGPGRSPKAERARSTPSASPSASTPVQVVAPSPTATKTPAPAPAPTKTAKPSPTPSPTQAPGTLKESPAEVQMSQNAAGGPFTGTFTLTASGGPVSYSITVPTSLSASPMSGTLKAGQTVTITVTGNGDDEQPTTLTVNPGGIQVTVEYPTPD